MRAQPSPKKPNGKKESAASKLVAFVVNQGGQDASGRRMSVPSRFSMTRMTAPLRDTSPKITLRFGRSNLEVQENPSPALLQQPLAPSSIAIRLLTLSLRWPV